MVKVKGNIFAALSLGIKKYVGCFIVLEYLGKFWENLKFVNFRHSGCMKGQERSPLKASDLIILYNKELKWACKHMYTGTGSQNLTRAPTSF